MKKKLFLTFIMVAILALTFVLAVSADSVHNENTVDYDATVTLDDGTVLPLFDENKEALVWYIDGKGADGKTNYSSARTDKAAKWYTEWWDEVTGCSVVLEDGTKIDDSNIVVINMMDDDVVKNSGPGPEHYGKPVTGFKTLLPYRKNLQYVYLRLDTSSINNNSFGGCAKLKYINLENLTQLKRMAQSGQFSGCTSLFDGQVLDLSKTQLTEFEGSGTFSGVPFKAVKFPETMVKIGSEKTFINCTKLETVSIGNKAKFGGSAFEGCTLLKAIYYVGTEEELSASTIGSVVTNATIKSYTEYKSLSDKSGVYIVYDYSYCEAFNDGVHAPVAINSCVGICDICGEIVVNHTEKENLSVSLKYEDYGVAGTKTIICQNEGCTYNAQEEIPALITCYGYSTPENGRGGIAIGFNVNKEAIRAYTENTRKTVKFGAFAIAQEKLTANGVLNSNGEANKGAIKAEVQSNMSSFELVISGFETDTQKNAMLALGAYVIATKDEEVKISYIQHGTPLEGDNYSFISYNELN